MARILEASLDIKVAPGGTTVAELGHGVGTDFDAGTASSAATGTIADALSSASRPITFTPGSAQSVTNGVLNSDYTAIVGPCIVDDGTATTSRYIGLDNLGSPRAAARGNFEVELEELPTLIAGDCANTSDIYCYSFALKPEEHQPSGTCNFSRIDVAKLISDQNFSASATSVIKVFAVNYNVLRIMSGMGGLAYSN